MSSPSAEKQEYTNNTIFVKAIEDWNRGDLDSYLIMYDPNVVIHGVPGIEPGLESAKIFYQGMHTAFPGIQITIDDLFIRGDKLACRFTVNGIHKAEFMGIPPTNKSIKLPGITILKFRDGKCVERWNQADFLGMLQQLGVIPENMA